MSLLVFGSMVVTKAWGVPPVVNAPVPGKAGRDNTVVVTGATPGAMVRLFVSRNAGITPIGRCPGTVLNLRDPRLVGATIADASGVAQFDFHVAGHFAGMESWYQAAQLATCDVSAHVSWLFPTPGTLSLQGADATFFGESYGEEAGHELAVGDFDGDGFSDLAIGAPDRAEPRWQGGAVYLVHGPLQGTLGLDGSDARWLGQDSDGAGWGLRSGCDLTGDGLDDLFVGASNNDDGGDDAGVIYLMSGRAGGDRDLAQAPARILGAPGDRLTDTACMGDTNGDGHSEIVVSAPGNSDGAPVGGALAWLDGPHLPGVRPVSTAYARLIGDITGGGIRRPVAEDLDGDGANDVAASAESYQSGIAVYVQYGPMTGDVFTSSADARLLQERPHDGAGFSLAGGGDADGDGRPDLLVGAPDEPYGTGQGYVVTTAPRGDTPLAAAHAKLVGELPNDVAGAAMAFASDLDQDGFDEVLISATGFDGSDDWTGRTYLVYGPVMGKIELSAAEVRFDWGGSFSWVGYRLATGDFDRDGITDLVMSAPWESSLAGDPNGAVFLVDGSRL